MKRFLLLATLASLTVSANPLLAQDVLSRPIQPTETFQFVSGSGVTATWGGVQVGPYSGTLLSDPTLPSLTLYCVDFANSIGYGNIVDVNTINVGDDGADLSTTRLKYDLATPYGFGPMATIDDRIVQYRQAAFLASMFATTTTVEWSGLHAAIWALMTPSFSSSYPAALALALPFLTLATDAADTGFVGFDFTEWSVLTDVNADGPTGGKQEYLVRTNVVPEPSTVILLLSGVLLLFVVGRKRFKELDEITQA